MIREAQPDDAADLLRLIRALAAYEREADAVRTTEEELRAALSATDPRVHALIAEVDGRIIGLALWFLTYSTWTGRSTLYLEDLFVEPRQRRTGIGRELMAALVAEAEQRACARVEWSVLDWNEPAINFYRSLGATPLDEWTTWRLGLPNPSDRQLL